MFKQIESLPPRLAEHVYQQIRDAIIAGEIPPSKRIVQDDIATKISVSRTPVREALFRLENEGILQKAGKNGFRTRGLSEDEARQIFQSREAVEGFAARIVAEERLPAKLDAVSDAVEQERGIDRKSFVDVFKANRRIHRTIVEQTGNAFMLKMFDTLWNQAISLPMFVASHVRLPVKAGDHDLLLKAMRTLPPRQAEQVMIDHIRSGLANQVAAIRERQAQEKGKPKPKA